jgi:hypothetical protein
MILRAETKIYASRKSKEIWPFSKDHTLQLAITEQWCSEIKFKSLKSISRVKSKEREKRSDIIFH